LMVCCSRSACSSSNPCCRRKCPSTSARGTDARHHLADVVVVVQGAHGDTREVGYRTDGVGVHAATIDPDAA
jgi:hypothetical protein